MESNRKGAQTCPSLVRESEGTRLVRVTNMPATDSQRPADAISPSAIPLATDPSFHTSSLLFLTTQEGGVMERSHSQHRLFTASPARIQTFAGESIIHLSLAISAIMLSILWFAYHGAFPCFPFAPILITLCHKHEDYEIFIVST